MSSIDNSGNTVFKCDASLCPIEKCVLYDFCSTKMNSGLLQKGMCPDCYSKYGKLVITSIITICDICLTKKTMVVMECKHLFCLECIFELFDEVYKPKNVCIKCPVCFDS